MRIVSAVCLLAMACAHPAPVTDSDWMARVEQHLAQREYRAISLDKADLLPFNT